MKIAICDDQTEFIKTIHRYIDEYAALTGTQCKVEEFSEGKRLIDSDVKYDAVFLDIELGDANGIDIAKTMQSKHKNTIIVIVTSHRGYLDDAMDIQVARFVDKPIEKERIFSALRKAVFETENNAITIHSKDNRIVRIQKSDIVFAEARLRRTMIVTLENTFTAREGIHPIQEKLNISNFAIPHNSYIVNMNFIKIFQREELLLDANGKEYMIPVSTRRQSELKKAYIRFIGEEK